MHTMDDTITMPMPTPATSNDHPHHHHSNDDNNNSNDTERCDSQYFFYSAILYVLQSTHRDVDCLRHARSHDNRAVSGWIVYNISLLPWVNCVQHITSTLGELCTTYHFYPGWIVYNISLLPWVNCVQHVTSTLSELCTTCHFCL